jgi:hypothetical protein
VLELINAVPRYYFQRHYLYSKYSELLHQVLPAKQTMKLSDIGNHSRGSRFVDLSTFITPALENVIDQVSKQYNTFYFGRYDIKFDNWQDLYQGKNFSIIELNGCGSEPTHIYDPNKKIWQAWSIILKHWRILYRIAKWNHQQGAKYMSFKEGRTLQKLEKQLKYFNTAAG